MLRRMSTANVSNPELEFNLWHNLGLIYRDRLKDTASAIEAIKMATRFKGDEVVERQILAELYDTTDQTEAAVAGKSTCAQRSRRTRSASIPTGASTSSICGLHEYDPKRVVHVCAALAFPCARRTTKSSDSSRITAPRG